MNKRICCALLIIIGTGFSFWADSAEHNTLRSPAKGVVCDAYFCADAAGVSDALTTKYLGAKKGQQLAAQGEFNRTAFTFANGIFCDAKEKVCRKGRYFVDGKRAGQTDPKTTQWLFAR